MNKETTLATVNDWGMIGHDWAVEMLQQHIAHDALRHAYLITGPAGVGRRTLALHLVQAIECTQPKAPGVPCKTCRTCKQIEAMKYPDLAIVQRDPEKRDLAIDQVRALRQQLVLTPYMGKHRVALLLRFHEASPNAYNALLKTLEEAPSQAILLLTADTTEGLPGTIVSRCEVLRLRPLPVEQVEGALKERGASVEQAHLLAHLSGGRPGVALRLLADDTGLDFRNERLEELHSLLGASRVEKFAYARKLTNKKSQESERLGETLDTWLSYWRDVLVAATGSIAPLVNVDREEEIRSAGEKMGLSAARRTVKRLEKAIHQVDRNVNTRLLVEVLLLDLPGWDE